MSGSYKQDRLGEQRIYRTTNHDFFVNDYANRPLIESKVVSMVAAIEKKNLLHLFPLVVGRDSVVIDGQHRLEAARRLNLPVYYVVSDDMAIEDAAAINQNVTRWRGQDWLHHWIVRGNQDYLALREFWQEFSFLTLAECLALTGGSGNNANSHQALAAGNFSPRRLRHGYVVGQMCLDFAKYVAFWHETMFVRALSVLANNPRYDHTRMMAKMEYLSARLQRSSTVDEYLTRLDEIYNYRTATKNQADLKIKGLRNARSASSRH